MQQEDKKKLIKEAAGKILKRLKGDKSLYILAMEYDISTSLLNNLERGLKDPQLTTIFKVAEALNVKASEFVKMVEEELPEGMTFAG